MSTNTAWLILIVAGFLETGWAIGLKYTEGFTRPLWSIVTIILIIASMFLLGVAANQLPIGTAYAVWTGIGAFGAAVIGIIVLKESVNPLRLLFLALLLVSIIGLKFSSSAAEAPRAAEPSTGGRAEHTDA